MSDRAKKISELTESNDEYNAFRYTDFCIAQFIEAAKKESYFKKTLFVFVGDHGLKGDAGNMLPRIISDNGFDVSNLKNGFYFLNIVSNNYTVFRKFIKQ